MKQTIFLIIITSSLVLFGACEDRKDSKEVAEETNKERFEDKDKRKDADFVTDAVASSYNEIRLADHAMKNATVAEIKNLASKLREEHNQVLRDLKSMSATKSIAIPDSGTAVATRDIKDLADEKGVDYDKKWLKEMEDIHEKSVKNFDDAAKNCEDSDLKAWAGTTLVSLRSHLDMIRNTREKIKL